MKNKKEFLIETDIFIDYLNCENTEMKTDLEIALVTGNCFTTVINSSELFLSYSKKDDFKKIKDLMSVVKVLGIHSRYSLQINKFGQKAENLRDALICTIASINKLPIFTKDLKKYNFCNVNILHPNDLRGTD